MNKKNIFEKTPHWIASRKIYFNKDLRFEMNEEAEDLLCKVVDNTTIRSKYDLMEEAFSCILGNLSQADLMDGPLVYSRNSNAYVIERKRYGYQFYTYKMVIRLVDAMYEMGLIQGVIGKKTESGRCLPSKMWATGELRDWFQTVGGSCFIKPNVEVLYLKDDRKHLMDYEDDTSTRAMRHQLCRLNEMLGSLEINFGIDYQGLSDNAVSRVNKFYKLVSLCHSNQIGIHINYSNDTDTLYLPDRIQLCQSDIVRQCQYQALPTKYYTLYDHDASIASNSNGFSIFGTVNPEANALRRVFNLDWYHGGRFYRAPHLTIPSACRETMTINGEPTVELDYSGLHIRMLYHRLGMDYREECYVYAKSDEDNSIDRKRMKLASLIVINSDDRQKAIKAIHDQCRKKGIHYPQGEYWKYNTLIAKFEEYHQPIKGFLFSGEGLDLQNQDSTIMASILDRLSSKGIPGLPVHDSIVCPSQNEDFLHQVMMEEYEKVMGFEPVIG